MLLFCSGASPWRLAIVYAYLWRVLEGFLVGLFKESIRVDILRYSLDVI